MATATCQTEGCANAGHGIDVGDVTAYDDNGDPDPDGSVSVICGVCDKPITDIA